MFFKKKKIISQQKKGYKTPYILGTVGVIFIVFLGSVVVQAMNSINFEIFDFANSSGSILNFGNDSKKESLDTTYILITGKGGGTHDAPNLTDTMILAGINKKLQTITLFSLPRDLWVKYPNANRGGRINAVYESFRNLKPAGQGMEKLQEVVTNITGKKVDYYINVDFAGFIEIVDALGGVQVTLENNLVDYEYPTSNRGYKTFILKAGTWNLDGEVALMFARSRHSSSDFDRSLRQQQIISSLREKVSSLGYFKDSKKILELYNIFTEYVETDMSLKNMISLGLVLKGWDNTQTLSFNLNDLCYPGSPNCGPGGFLYTPNRELFGGASVVLPGGGSASNPSSYKEITQFSDLIYESSDMFTNPKNIIIYNTTKQSLYANKLAEKLRPFGFSIDFKTGTQSLKEKEFEKSILYYNTLDENDSTLRALKDFIDIEFIQTPEAMFSPTGTHIEIILADTTSF